MWVCVRTFGSPSAPRGLVTTGRLPGECDPDPAVGAKGCGAVGASERRVDDDDDDDDDDDGDGDARNDDDDDDDGDADDVVVERATGGEVRTVRATTSRAMGTMDTLVGVIFSRARGARARGREGEAWTRCARMRGMVVIASDWCGRGEWWRCVRG